MIGPMPTVPSPNKPTSPFERHLDVERIRSMRKIALLASLLYLIFGILDIWAIPSAVTTVWLIQSFVVIISIGIFGSRDFRFFFSTTSLSRYFSILFWEWASSDDFCCPA